MKKVCVFTLFVLLTVQKLAAQNAEKALIETTIQYYFDGWMTGDTTKVGKAMHATCHLKYFRDGKFADISRADI